MTIGKGDRQYKNKPLPEKRLRENQGDKLESQLPHQQRFAAHFFGLL